MRRVPGEKKRVIRSERLSPKPLKTRSQNKRVEKSFRGGRPERDERAEIQAPTTQSNTPRLPP